MAGCGFGCRPCHTDFRPPAMNAGDARPAVTGLASYSEYIPLIARLLTSLAKKGDALRRAATPRTVYDGGVIPPITVEDYLYRWVRYSYCSPETFMMAVVIIDKLADKIALQLNSLNVHRVALAALAVAAKLRDDIYYSNKYYASIGGITMKEMNRLEAALLTDCDWDLFVDEEQYARYKEMFDRHRACEPKPPHHEPSSPEIVVKNTEVQTCFG